MKPLHLASLAITLATAAGCSRPADATRRAALDCPQREGELTRASVSADGRACVYADAGGDAVSLRLIPVSSTPEAALRPIEEELQALVPPAKPAAASADDGASEERAQVSLPGVRIEADHDKADVRIGSLHVNAAGGGAVVREARDVRLRGESLSRERHGYRAMYIVARDDLPGGLRSVGYEAGGPRKGPLTVAVVRAKTRADDLHRDVRRLVRRNGGI